MIIREISLEQNLDYREEIQKVLQGVKVVSKYNNVTYEVKDICFDLNTESTFELCHEGQKYEVSYFDYFTKRYTETITQKKQPLLLATRHPKSKTEKDVYLVPELCYLLGMTE